MRYVEMKFKDDFRSIVEGVSLLEHILEIYDIDDTQLLEWIEEAYDVIYKLNMFVVDVAAAIKVDKDLKEMEKVKEEPLYEVM